MNCNAESPMNRRRALHQLVMGTAAMPLLSHSLAFGAAESEYNDTAPPYPSKRLFPLDQKDHLLLDEIGRAAFRYFWENSHPKTGLTKDRSSATGTDERNVASIAATGFGLTTMCIAAHRGWHDGREISERVRKTLRWIFEWMPQEHGFFYHFVDWSNGHRMWGCELSSIDTAILLCGIITCGEYFIDPEIRDLSATLYQRVEWQWMLNGGATLAHGWMPESGFLKNRWDHYCELMLLYLLAMGTDTNRIPGSSWDAWQRPVYQEEKLRYIGSPAPLFVHQYAHAWFDFYGLHDRHVNYFDNSILATEAHRRFCLGLADQYPHYSADLWGITASDSVNGYVIWGGPPAMGPIDGTVVPCAAAGSLPFIPSECLRVLRTLKSKYGDKVWKRYGFADAFNPQTGWVGRDVIGIDVGITALMAENARTGLVWDTFMKNPYVKKAMQRAKFKSAQNVRTNTYLPN
ncbi:hypothetical protein GC207_13170 [bacterium]|nr:hypothetical protein [bacterium]